MRWRRAEMPTIDKRGVKPDKTASPFPGEQFNPETIND